ncbi:MAG: site-specific integrase [Sulfurimonas sp.]|nr:site-specific integrase [Sulfurimonas sp.]MDQ7067723.1 site-specific integrase [Sulfurimonas sp.]
MARPKGTTRAKKPIMKREFERLLRSIDSSLDVQASTKIKFICAFTLLYLTGCRISEIINFTTHDLQKMIDENEYSLTNATKTKATRLISFDSNKVQVQLLKKILPEKERYLFCKNNSTQAMSVASLKFMTNKFIHKTLGELYSTHSFRAGYITVAHKIGLSLEHIRQDIGHKSIATTARYATVTSDEIAQSKNMIAW